MQHRNSLLKGAIEKKTINHEQKKQATRYSNVKCVVRRGRGSEFRVEELDSPGDKGGCPLLFPAARTLFLVLWFVFALTFLLHPLPPVFFLSVLTLLGLMSFRGIKTCGILFRLSFIINGSLQLLL